MHTLYDVLGARPGDNAETLTKAFRKAALASHPDLHRGDAEAAARFASITDAYHVLRDVEQRAAYDEELAFERQELRREARRSALRVGVHAAAVAAGVAAGWAWWAGVPQTILDDLRSRQTAAVQTDPLASGVPSAGAGGPQMPIMVMPPPAQAPSGAGPDRPTTTGDTGPGDGTAKDTAKIAAEDTAGAQPQAPAIEIATMAVEVPADATTPDVADAIAAPAADAADTGVPGPAAGHGPKAAVPANQELHAAAAPGRTKLTDPKLPDPRLSAQAQPKRHNIADRTADRPLPPIEQAALTTAPGAAPASAAGRAPAPALILGVGY